MRKIKIITDSCSDLNGELLEKYDIDYGRMYTVDQGKETEASLTWEHFSPKELYDKIRNGSRITTTQVPMQEFMRIFKKYLDQDYDIIYIACSSKQSSSVNTGTVAAKDILKDYPDARIECIDSLNACIGEGILAMHASELVTAGKTFDEIVSEINGMRNNIQEFIAPVSLEYMKRAGRVKASKAFMGNLFNVKPILISDADGVQTPIKKAKGRKQSMEEIVNLMAEAITEPETRTIYIANADCSEEDINYVREQIKAKIKCKDIVPITIGPIIGASIGPDAIGVWSIGKEITYRVGEAKA